MTPVVAKLLLIYLHYNLCMEQDLDILVGADMYEVGDRGDWNPVCIVFSFLQLCAHPTSKQNHLVACSDLIQSSTYLLNIV